MKNQDHQNKPKIVYFGTSDFAVPALRYLVQNGYAVVGVATQPEKPVGRARVIMPSPVKNAALELGLKVFEPHSLKKDEEFLKHFRHLEPDVAVIAAYGKIVPVEYLEIPKYGFINIHPSLLPKYRGPSPIQTAILNGDEESGVSIMKIDEDVDHGPLLGSGIYKIKENKGYQEIQREMAELGGKLLLEFLPKYLSGELVPTEQEHSKASFTRMLSRDDGRISWRKTAAEIANQIRALNPEPGTWATWERKAINIKNAEISTYEVEDDVRPGTVRKVGNLIAVATQKCYLILRQIQLEGGKEMDVKSFVNGHPDFLGSRLI